MVKDLGFVAAKARRVGMTVEQAALSREIYTAVADAGLGEQDMSVVHELIRHGSRTTET